MVNDGLADKCRMWVDEYCKSDYDTPQDMPRGVSDSIGRQNGRPACSFEKFYWVERDYRLVEVANVEARIDARSRLGKFSGSSLDGIFEQFGESYVRYGYLLLPRLFCLITGKKPIYYCDKDTEIHVRELLSQLEDNAIHRAEAIGADLAIMERDNIDVKENFSGIIHLVTIKLGVKYLFHYNANANAEFYRRKT